MIGDTEYDLEMARNARMDSLAVSYGVHETARLHRHGPLACVDSVAQMHNWLRGRAA
jgi:phosphoglycolate phosphatase